MKHSKPTITAFLAAVFLTVPTLAQSRPSCTSDVRSDGSSHHSGLLTSLSDRPLNRHRGNSSSGGAKPASSHSDRALRRGRTMGHCGVACARQRRGPPWAPMGVQGAIRGSNRKRLDPIPRYGVDTSGNAKERPVVNTSTPLNIGGLAKQAEVNIQTIRYYERRGLLPEPERTASNYRVYAGDTVRRVRFIKRAQDLGFTLSEIKELLDLRASPRSRCEDVRARSKAKIRDIDEKVHSLEAMRRALSKLVRACSGRGPVTECPILESLEEEV